MARQGETVIKGTRYVRLRSDYPNVGPFRLHMWIVTNLHDRKRIGHRHLSREAAARWVVEQGWRYVGTQVQVQVQSVRRRSRVPDCPRCAEDPKGEQLMPPHDASTRCESGRHPHCSCSICF